MPSAGRAFYKLDQHLRFQSANEVALALWGKTTDQVIGRTLAEVFPQAVGSEPYEAHHSALRSLAPYRGKASTPVLGMTIELEIYPRENDLDVSFLVLPPGTRERP